MSMPRCARNRQKNRKHPKMQEKSVPEIQAVISGCKLSFHAERRILERISSDSSLVDTYQRLGSIIDHPERIEVGKNGRAVYRGGGYAIVLDKHDYRNCQVIVTIIKESN